MVKFIPNIFLGLVLFFTSARLAWSQGFVNLDFESATIIQNNGFQTFVSDAFPGWAVTAPYITYDAPSLSGASISITDTGGYPPNPIQGNYWVFLATGLFPVTDVNISLGQSGTIPLGTESMSFWGNLGGLQITLAGQSLAFSETGSTANYNIYSADVSAFAGQSGQLLFSLPAYTSNATLDNIQFSTSSVPEPSVFVLTALGGLLLSFRRRKISSV
jgi:hypothetical protein